MEHPADFFSAYSKKNQQMFDNDYDVKSFFSTNIARRKVTLDTQIKDLTKQPQFFLPEAQKKSLKVNKYKN